MAEFDLARIRRMHIVGIGGAGMSAIAKLTFQGGIEVSGSDLRDSVELHTLSDLGISTWSGHHPERLPPVDLVIASSAVPLGDPELEAARRQGIPVLMRPDFLAELTRSLTTIGPTGTHGKTTTTAMLVLAARACGLDPSFVVGGEMIDLATNAHRGVDPLLILEVDEAFGTFERITLAGLIVTNVEPDHLDYFGTVERMEATYHDVAAGVDGPVLMCVDDPVASRIMRDIGAVGYGFGDEARWRIDEFEPKPDSVSFRLKGSGEPVVVQVPRPGRHVGVNAAGAIALLAELGHDPRRAAAGLARFRGVRRRFEHRGTVGGVTMIDDYAHHPTEVRATLTAARAAQPERLWAVFQPHLYSRTGQMYRELGEALAMADRVVVTDVYAAREAPIPGVTGELVAEAARQTGAEVIYLAHRADLAAELARQIRSGDLVVTMGAGDITVVPTELAVLLAGDDRAGRA
jgi:UDP-N-acetylmuramate--alanine ligase